MSTDVHQPHPVSAVAVVVADPRVLGAAASVSAAVPTAPLPRAAQHHHIGAPNEHEAIGIQHYYKLYFPTFDGCEDPRGWLNRCEQFFRAQRTREGDKVVLVSFHMKGAAQHWYYMLERCALPTALWSHFKALCPAPVSFHGPTSRRSGNSALAWPWGQSPGGSHAHSFPQIHQRLLTPEQQALLVFRRPVGQHPY